MEKSKLERSADDLTKVMKIKPTDYEGWTECAISKKEFYMNSGHGFFIDLLPISYDEALKILLRSIEDQRLLKFNDSHSN